MNKCAVIVLNTVIFPKLFCIYRNTALYITARIKIFPLIKFIFFCSPTIIISHQRIQVKIQYPALNKTDGRYAISRQASTQSTLFTFCKNIYSSVGLTLDIITMPTVILFI